jgi:hypothetical protein
MQVVSWQRGGAGGAMSFIGAMPVKKAPNAPRRCRLPSTMKVVSCRGQEQAE